MINNILFTILLISTNSLAAQRCAGFEQYVYFSRSQIQLVVPVVYFQTKNNWYIESHVNYEAPGTFSIYTGKAYSGGKNVSYTLTPMAGAVCGSLTGAVIGLNASITYKKITYSSQSQFICSFAASGIDFLYTWVEIGYQVLRPLLAGFAAQHTMRWGKDRELEPGFFIKLTVKKWDFPLYCFNAGTESRYLVLGVCREFALPANHANSTLPLKPSFNND